MKKKRKLTLDLGALEVQSFAVPRSYDKVQGTVHAQSPETGHFTCDTCASTCLQGDTCAGTCGCYTDPVCTTGCQTSPGNTCGAGSACEEDTQCAGCTSEWLCGATNDTCQCPTQTPGDTVCYDTITCCEQRA